MRWKEYGRRWRRLYRMRRGIMGSMRSVNMKVRDKKGHQQRGQQKGGAKEGGRVNNYNNNSQNTANIGTITRQK